MAFVTKIVRVSLCLAASALVLSCEHGAPVHDHASRDQKQTEETVGMHSEPYLMKLEIKQLPAIRIIGKTITHNLDNPTNPIPAFWDQCFQDGTFATLEKIGKSTEDSYVGWMYDYIGSENTFVYMCGMMMQADTEVPEGFVKYDVPAGDVAIGWIYGKEPDIYGAAHHLTLGSMAQQGYIENGPWSAEVYNCPRFTKKDEKGNVILDYYIPCGKKE